MPVNVQLLYEGDAPEYDDARALAAILREGLSTCEGSIGIAPKVQLFGQATKDVDLVVYGTLSRCVLRLPIPSTQDANIAERSLTVDNFICTVEVKEHSGHKVKMHPSGALLVKYGDHWHDASSQSVNQRIALQNHMKARMTGRSPWIYSLIWMRNLDQRAIDDKLQASDMNIIPGTHSAGDFFRLLCLQRVPYQDRNGRCYLSSYRSDDDVVKGEVDWVVGQFCREIEGVGEMSRKHVELVTSHLIGDDVRSLLADVGRKLVVITGRAGTGKTVTLLQMACRLAMEEQKRCLILTYNRALVGDIQRTLALSGGGEAADSGSVVPMTLHKFFRDLTKGIGNDVDDFLDHYEVKLHGLKRALDRARAEGDIQDAFTQQHDIVAWDYVFVDESQDCTEQEKQILFSLFDYRRIVVADGVDQLVRTAARCDWGRNVVVHKLRYHRGLRQKRNLANFVKSVAGENRIRWDIEAVDSLPGGHIIISEEPFPTKIITDTRDKCIESGNRAYEMLILVPPSLVTPAGFSKIDRCEEVGLKIWDGTADWNPELYPSDVAQHRLLQYESCRGLEGWSVVCLCLDDYVGWKYRSFLQQDDHAHALEAPEERASRLAWIWTLIVLTRAIDTLVLTVRDPQSSTAELLRRMSKKHPDFIEYSASSTT